MTSTRRWTLREADLEEGQEWTGWHRIEKDLWPPSAPRTTRRSTPGRARRRTPTTCVANTETLDDARPGRSTSPLDQIANGARGLLDEVATGKVTGEEEYWSHTDLWDFQANVDGARVGFEGVQRRSLESEDPELADDPRRSASPTLQTLLDAQRDRRRLRALRRARRPSRGQGARPTPVNALVRAAVAADRGGRCPDDRMLTDDLLPDQADELRCRRRRVRAARSSAWPAAARRRSARRPGGRRRARRRRADRDRDGAASGTSYPFRGDAPGRHRHPGAGPAALRGVRRHDRRRATSSSPCCRHWTDGGGADDRRARPPARSARPSGAVRRPARRHRRGDRACRPPG